jgi:hypothetical protein
MTETGLLLGGSIAPTRKRARNLAAKNQKWTPEEDALLHSIVQSTETMNWKSAETQFPGKTSQQLFERWTKVLDPRLLKGSWTRQEDEVIIQYVQTYGCQSWTKLAQLLPGRIGKQCRERWFNHLNPDLSRGQWTPEEDQRLLELHEQFGNHWSKIAMLMPTRADNMIKNRWYSTIAKKSKEEIAEAAQNYHPSPTAQHHVSFGQSPGVFDDGMSTPRMGGSPGDSMWTPQFRPTPLTIPTTPGTLGLISPMAPSASPFGLMSPFPKMMSMFSPAGSDALRNDMFSPMKPVRGSLTENRAELINLMGQT